MRTSKSFEIISYNTDNFFDLKITELKREKIISFAFWIRHQPDTDEKKEHIHCYIIPTQLLQTDDFVENFTEIDPKNPDKPFKARCERTSNYDFKTGRWDDALLYSIHDEKYLKNKGLKRNIHYKWTDLKSTDEDQLEATINRIIPWADKPVEKMAALIREGHGDYETMVEAGIPYEKAPAAKVWIDAARRANRMYLPERKGKLSHTPRMVCCKICGEIKPIQEFPYLTVETDLEGHDYGTCYACLWKQETEK